PRAGRHRNVARLGARRLWVRHAAARSTRKGVRAPAARHTRPGIRVARRRAGGAKAHRAARSIVKKSGAAMVQSRAGRGAALARLALRIGGRYIARSPRLVFASVERRRELRHDLALRSADDVAEELGAMRGVLMKLGQMASYIYEDLPVTVRTTMGRLQQTAPPMSPEAAIDSGLEARSQELFASYYDGHPYINVPHVVPGLSTARVLTSDLVSGSRFEEMQRWSQHERDLAAETIYRFVFRSLYRIHAFNGDPHPGNYVFHGDGRVSFLDFGLTKTFTDHDLAPLVDAVRLLVF